MQVKWVEEFSPKTAPSPRLAKLVARFRPEFGNERHIEIRDGYGRLLELFREIETAAARRVGRQPHRRLTKAERDAEALEQTLVQQLEVLRKRV